MKKKFLKNIIFVFLAFIGSIVSYGCVLLGVNKDLNSDVFYQIVTNSISGLFNVYNSSFDESFGNGFRYFHNTEASPYVVVFSILGLVILLSILIHIIKNSNSEYINSISALLRQKKSLPFDVSKINTILPDFNAEKFKNDTYDIYMQIQSAWMNFDNINLRNLVTDEMYNMYLDQLELFEIHNKQNIIQDFKLFNFEIMGMDYDDQNISITANYEILCYDYIIDRSSKVILKGRNNKKVVYLYQMIFIRGIVTDDNNNFCPNCGAPVSDKASKKCAYCESVIVSNEHDWVLSQKKVLKQHYY